MLNIRRLSQHHARFGTAFSPALSRATVLRTPKTPFLSCHPVWARHLCSTPTKPINTASQTSDGNQNHVPSPSPENASILLGAKNPYAQAPLHVVLRSLLILQLCAFPVLVMNAQRIISFARTVFGDKLTGIVIKKSFFRHFCGGENKEEILPTIDQFNSMGIGTILDYAAEADAPSASQTVESYSGEAKCDATLDLCLDAVLAASQRKDGFIAVKLTGLGNPELLLRISEVITHIRSTFSTLFEKSSDEDTETGTTASGVVMTAGVYSPVLRGSEFASRHHLNRALNFEEFAYGVQQLGLNIPQSELHQIFKSMDSSIDGRVDFLEWVEYVQPTDVSYRPFFVSNYAGNDRLNALSEDEVQQMDRLVARLYKLAESAKNHRVRVLVDAEHTYFQPAIDHLVLHLQRRYNSEFPTIFNTYQCYLRDSKMRIMIDIERAKREKFFFAAKVVRGAYMNQERKRADMKGEESPIHLSKAKTDSNFQSCVNQILNRSPRFSLMVATHNETSVETTVRKMQELGMPKTGNVYFAQLMGMSDYLTYALANNGYTVLKYVPYGPVFEVMPYLIRRAEENAAIMSSPGRGQERVMLWKVLKQRLGLARSS